MNMKYVALDFRISGGEVVGLEAVIDDLNLKEPLVENRFLKNHDDTSRLSRDLAAFLVHHGFPVNDRLVVEATIYGYVPLEPLFGLQTFHRYILPVGGIINPSTLFLKDSVTPPHWDTLTTLQGIDAIIDIVRKWHASQKTPSKRKASNSKSSK